MKLGQVHCPSPFPFILFFSVHSSSSSPLLFFSVHSSSSFPEGYHCAVLPEPSELEREGCPSSNFARTFGNSGVSNHLPALHNLPRFQGGQLRPAPVSVDWSPVFIRNHWFRIFTSIVHSVKTYLWALSVLSQNDTEKGSTSYAEFYTILFLTTSGRSGTRNHKFLFPSVGMLRCWWKWVLVWLSWLLSLRRVFWTETATRRPFGHFIGSFLYGP